MPPTKSRGSKMMCSNPQIFLHGRKLENHFEKLRIFAKRFERFLNFCKNAKRPIFQADLPPDTLRYRKKSHIPRRSARKNEKNVHLRFLNFENSSHTFFNDRKSIFQKFKMCEILKNRKSLKLFCKNAKLLEIIFKFWAA